MVSDSTNTQQISWPANHRAALIVLIHVDAPDLGDDPAASGGLDYTATGLQRLLRAFADLDVPVTAAWTNRALATYPQIARAALDQGHELAISRIRNVNNLDENLIARISDLPPSGSVEALPLPGLGATEATSTPENSLYWTINGTGGDLPVRLASQSDAPQATIIPVNPFWIDLAWLNPDRPLPPSSLLEAWSFGLSAVRTEGGLMTVVVHPHISGRPGFADSLVRFVDEAIASGDVWIASAAQVAEWWRRQTDAVGE